MIVRLSLGVECSTKTKRPDPLTTAEALLSNPEIGVSKMATPTLPERAPAHNQLLYILRSSADNLIKVGVSRDPEQRLRQLVTGHPYELEVAYVVEFEENLAESVEKITKAILDHCKTKDRGEWFAISVSGAIEAIKLAREVHEFCRKRIPPTVVEVHVEKVTYRPVLQWRRLSQWMDRDAEHLPPEKVKPIYVSIGTIAFGIAMIAFTVTAYINGMSIFPQQILDNNAHNFGEWTRSVAYCNEQGMRLIGPILLLFGIADVVDFVKRKRFAALLRV
jgi:hypothetical protein